MTRKKVDSSFKTPVSDYKFSLSLFYQSNREDARCVAGVAAATPFFQLLFHKLKMSQNFSKMSLKCFQNVSKSLQNVSKMFPKCLQNVSKMSPKCLQNVSNVSKLSPKCFQNVSKMFRKWLQNVLIETFPPLQATPISNSYRPPCKVTFNI